MPASFSVSMTFASFFGLLAGACAFLITYDEYVHHFPDKRKAFKMAFTAGLTAFLFFWSLTLLLFPLLMKVIRSS